MTRPCPDCQRTLPLDAFGRRMVGGVPRPQPYCRACHARRVLAWRKKPGNAERQDAATRRYQERHPLRKEARRLVRLALVRGELVKAPCLDCGAPEVQAHHPDYAKPLEVEWLCRPCHGKRHRRAA